MAAHKELLVQIGMIDEALEKASTATSGLIASMGAGIGEGYVAEKRQSVNSSYGKLAGFLSGFSESISKVASECGEMIRWCESMQPQDKKAAQQKYRTEYGYRGPEVILARVKEDLNKLLSKVRSYLQIILKLAQQRYPDTTAFRDFYRAYTADAQIPAWTKGIIEDMESAIDMQRALSAKPGKQKESFFARLFGRRPKPALAGARI